MGLIGSDLLSRSPCGERGLKSVKVFRLFRSTWSLPVRGAWIEIFMRMKPENYTRCRSPCGERGLKWLHFRDLRVALLSRSPCGERGLKFPSEYGQFPPAPSLPVRGAWIEI